MIPPAPTHNARLFEKTPWSKPGISFWRSPAPGMALPRRLTDVLETVNPGCMVLNPLSIDFDFELLVQADETHESVAAEDRHDRDVPGGFKAFLKVLIRSRRMRG